MGKHTLSIMDWFVSKSKNLLNQSCLYSWSFPFQQKKKTDMLWGHVCKYVSVIGLIFIGVAFWMENISKDIKRSHLRVYVAVWYLPGCPRAGRAYPHLHPGWNKTANRDTYESREQTWMKKHTHTKEMTRSIFCYKSCLIFVRQNVCLCCQQDVWVFHQSRCLFSWCWKRRCCHWCFFCISTNFLNIQANRSTCIYL